MSKHREVTWDHRRSRKYVHVGKVSVFFRGASWHIYYREDGKVRRIRIGPDRDEAEKRAAEVNAQLAHGIPSAFGFERVTVGELVKLWIEHHELVLRSSVATARRYRAAVEHLLRFVRQSHPRLTAVDFGARVMHVRNRAELGWKTKTRSERRIYLFDELLDVVRRAAGDRACGTLFLAPRFGPGILFRVRRVRRRGLAIDSDCPVLPRQTMRLAEEPHVDVVGKRGERHLRHPPRQACYPMKSR